MDTWRTPLRLAPVAPRTRRGTAAVSTARRPRLFHLALGVFILLAFGGAAAAAGLVEAVNSPTQNFDPSLESSVPNQRLVTAAYDALVTINPKTETVEPALATAWSMNSDATQLELTLRQGVKFHDGTTFDATAVKDSLERTLKIGKGESFLISAIKDIKIESPDKVLITLSSPQPEFLYGLSRMFIMSPTAIKEHAVNGDMAQAWFTTHEDGTGPYQLTEWVQNQRYVFKKFPDYWRGWQGNHFDTLTFRVVVEDATQQLLLKSGQIDVAENIPLDNVPGLESDPNITVVNTPQPNPFYIAFDVNRKPLNDVRVRKAIALAFDYKAAIDAGVNGYGTPMRGPIPPSYAGFNENIPASHQDMAQAKKLLAEAGYPNGGFTLTFLYLEHWLFERNVGLVLQQNLKDLGITLKLQGQPWATMTAKMKDPSQSPDLVMYAVTTPTPTPLSILQPMYESTSQHWSHFWYSNPKVDSLLKQAGDTVDKTAREDIYKQIQQIIYDDQPQIFAFSENEVVTMRSNIKGYEARPQWPKLLNYYGMYKE